MYTTLTRGLLRTALCLISATVFVELHIAKAADTDSLGSTNKFHIPIPSPSMDATPKRFVLNGQAYEIPRNFIETTESLPSGELANVSLRVLWPDLTAMTPSTADCFLDNKSMCHARVMTIGIDDDAISVSGEGRLKATKGISHPDERTGPCGFHYYESLGSISNGAMVFDFYFTKFSGASDLSLARCVKEGSVGAPMCDSEENLGVNHFYYIFPRDEICQWPALRSRVINLLTSFKRS